MSMPSLGSHSPLGVGRSGESGRRSVSAVAAAVLSVGGLVVVVVGMSMLITAGLDLASGDGSRRDAVAEVALPGEETVDLAAGSYVALALGDGLVRATYDQVTERVDAVRGPFAAPLIGVVGPAGSALELRSPRVDTLEDRPGADIASLVEFTVRDAGAHVITVEPAPGSTGGPVASVILRESDGLDAFGVGDFVVGFVLVFAGGTAVLIGVLLGVASLLPRRR